MGLLGFAKAGSLRSTRVCVTTLAASFFSPPAAKLVSESLLNLIAQCALGVSADGIERDRVEKPARKFAAEKDEANLRPVPMGDDHTKTLFNQVGDMQGRLNHGRILVGNAHVFRVFDQRIAADSYDNGLHNKEHPNNLT